MQRYFEPYFNAIEAWLKYENNDLLSNRIELIDAACKISKKFHRSTEYFEFNLVCQKQEHEFNFLPEVISSIHKYFALEGDTLVFNKLKSTVPSNLFEKAGLFFENELLQAFNGWTPNFTATSNIDTIQSFATMIEKIFRLPEEAGFARIEYRKAK